MYGPEIGKRAVWFVSILLVETWNNKNFQIGHINSTCLSSFLHELRVVFSDWKGVSFFKVESPGNCTLSGDFLWKGCIWLSDFLKYYKSQEQRSKSKDPRTKNQEQRSKIHEPGHKNQDICMLKFLIRLICSMSIRFPLWGRSIFVLLEPFIRWQTNQKRYETNECKRSNCKL